MVYFNLQEAPEYKRGLEYEIKAQHVIKKIEKVDIIETCNNSDYDFRDSNLKTYEVKKKQVLKQRTGDLHSLLPFN